MADRARAFASTPRLGYAIRPRAGDRGIRRELDRLPITWLD
jgi:hypothetical protein